MKRGLQWVGDDLPRLRCMAAHVAVQVTKLQPYLNPLQALVMVKSFIHPYESQPSTLASPSPSSP